MKPTYRRLLTLFTLGISLLSIAGLAFFFLSLYREDKIATIFEAELNNARSAAAHIEKGLRLANSITLEEVENSHEIGFISEDPCDPRKPGKFALSGSFKRQMEQLHFNPLTWKNGLEVFKACEDLTSGQRKTDNEFKALSIPSTLQSMTPYFLLVLRHGDGFRLAMLLLDGFQTSTANTLFLTDSLGNPFWSADGDEYLASALKDTGLSPPELTATATAALKKGESKTEWKGHEGLLSVAPIGNTWLLMSLSHAPQVTRSVTYATQQFFWLALGFLLLCFFLGKNLAEWVTLPFRRLVEATEEIGAGKFGTRLGSASFQEFASVNHAFNVMSDKIQELIRKARESAFIQKDLQTAEQVQHLLLPPTLVEVNHHKIVSFMKAAQFVGGDWWGYLELPRLGKDSAGPPLLMVMVGDATGHGVPPALVAATVRGAQSLLLQWMKDAAENQREMTIDPCKVLEYFNKTVYDASKGTITLTLFAALFDTEKRKLLCANAAHAFPYLINAKGSKTIGKDGVPLGHHPETVYTNLQEFDWNPGDKLFLYSDGLTDCATDEKTFFDRKSLVKILRANPTASAKTLLNKVLRTREQAAVGVPQEDDITVVICEALGGPA